MKSTIGIIIICCLFACLANSIQGFNCAPAPEPVPVQVEYFKNGQILYPDYAITDTLIVRDAAGLNKAMAPEEQGLHAYGDAEIDSLFHVYCEVLHTCNWTECPYKDTQDKDFKPGIEIGAIASLHKLYPSLSYNELITRPHTCRWEHCPYKGVTIQNYRSAICYEEGTEAYSLDCLHIITPTADYDQLVTMLQED